MNPRSAILLLALALTSPAGAQQVVITEFLALNSTGLRDEDGDSSDWIELFNPGADAVDLQGWYLPDDRINLLKWRFPAATVPPSGFLLVFASGKNRAVPGLPLHANFSLNAAGEYLGLVRPDGLTVVSEFAPSFPAQRADVSYGLLMSGTLVLTNLPTYLPPSPGLPNLGNTPPVRFSRPSGTFVTPFDLTLSIDSTNAVIRYIAFTNLPTSAIVPTNLLLSDPQSASNRFYRVATPRTP